MGNVPPDKRRCNTWPPCMLNMSWKLKWLLVESPCNCNRNIRVSNSFSVLEFFLNFSKNQSWFVYFQKLRFTKRNFSWENHATSTRKSIWEFWIRRFDGNDKNFGKNVVYFMILKNVLLIFWIKLQMVLVFWPNSKLKSKSKSMHYSPNLHWQVSKEHVSSPRRCLHSKWQKALFSWLQARL